MSSYSSHRQTGSSSRYATESSSSRYATEIPSRPSQSTRLSTKGGDELLIRSPSTKQSTHASRATGYDEKTMRGSSRRESFTTVGGSRHEVPNSSRSRAPPQTTYNDGRQTVVQSPYTSDSRRPETSSHSRVKTIYSEEEMRASTRDSGRTRDSDRTVTPTKTSTRKTAAPTAYKETYVGGDSRALVPRVQTLRDDDRAMTRKPSSSRSAAPPSSHSGSSSITQLGRRVERLEDEKSRKLEREVEKLTDKVEQLQMNQSSRRDYLAPAYVGGYSCACDYCLYSTGPYCMVRL